LIKLERTKAVIFVGLMRILGDKLLVFKGSKLHS